MGSNLDWNSIRADIGSPSESMRTATGAISQAGTVFGELRKSILDEEQRAVDNAYRTKLFDENVKQFGMQHALDQDKLSEEILSHRNSEGLTARGHDVTSRGQDLSYKSSMAGVGAQMAGIGLQREKFNADQSLIAEQRNRQAIGEQVQNDLIANKSALDNEYKDVSSLLQSSTKLTPEEYAKADDKTKMENTTLDSKDYAANVSRLNDLSQKRTAFNGTGLEQAITAETLKRGGGLQSINIASTYAEQERSRALADVKRKMDKEHSYNTGLAQAQESINKLNLGQEGTAAASAALVAGMSLAPDLNPAILGSIIAGQPITDERLTSKYKFDSGYSIGDSVIEEFAKNPKNAENAVYQQIMAASKQSSGLERPSDVIKATASTPQQDLRLLTDEALKYRESTILKESKDPSSVLFKDDEVQSKFNKMYKASYGDMPKSEVPKDDLNKLKENAVQSAREDLKRMRDKALEKVKSEANRRKVIESVIDSNYYP